MSPENNLQKQGIVDEVEARQTLLEDPDNFEALCYMGLFHVRNKEFPESIGFFVNALKHQIATNEVEASLVSAISNLTKNAIERNECFPAENLLAECLGAIPKNSSIYYFYSFFLSKFGEYEKALGLTEVGLKINNRDARLYDAMGLSYTGLGEYDLALKSFDQSLQIDSKFVSALINKSRALIELGQSNDALGILKGLVKSEKENIHVLNNLGLAFADIKEVSESIKVLEEAIEINNDFAEAHFNLARVLLMNGDYRRGWDEHEWRWKCRDFDSELRKFPYQAWNGEEIKGKKILIWSEQGIGDEIMFLSPLQQLISDGATVVLECSEKLVNIFSRSLPDVTVVSRTTPPKKDTLMSDIEFQLPLASLSRFYRKSSESFAVNSGEYLFPKTSLVAELNQRYRGLGDGPLVGICWKSGNLKVGAERSIPLELWKQILLKKPCRFLSLQYGDSRSDTSIYENNSDIHIHVDEKVNPLDDAESWFAQIATVDLVISVDNSTIQVSGSQGVPTWTLVNFNPEWRFGLRGEKNDWHPSMKVYRQTKEGDWESIISQVADDFTGWLESFIG